MAPPRLTKNSNKPPEPTDILPQEMDNSNSSSTFEDRLSKMEQSTSERLDEMTAALKELMQQSRRQQKQKSSFTADDPNNDDESHDSEDSATDEEDAWRHMKVNLTKCQHMVDKWSGQKKMDFMLWTVSFRRAAVSLDIWDFFSKDMAVPRAAADLKIFRKNHFKCFQFLESHLPLDVSANLQPFDDEPNSSRVAWSHLCIKYGKTDKETVRALNNSLSNIQMQADETGEEYFERAQKLRNSLAARRSYLDDADFTDYLIQGLEKFPAYVGVEQQYVAAKADGRYMSPDAVEKSIKIAARSADQFVRRKTQATATTPSLSPSVATASPTLLANSTQSSILEVNLAARKETTPAVSHPCWRCGDLGHKYWNCPNAAKWPNWVKPVYDSRGLLVSRGTGGATPVKPQIYNLGRSSGRRPSGGEATAASAQTSSSSPSPSPAISHNSPSVHTPFQGCTQVLDNDYIPASPLSLPYFGDFAPCDHHVGMTLLDFSSSAVLLPDSAKESNSDKSSDCSMTPSTPLQSSTHWIADSGADQHMTSMSSYFYSWTYLAKPFHIKMANGSISLAQAEGSIRFLTSSGADFVLHNVLFVPASVNNLISVKQLRDYGVILHCDAAGYHLRMESTGHILARDLDRPGTRLIWLDLAVNKPDTNPNVLICGAAMVQAKACADTWHQRLGHPARDVVQQLVNGHLAHGLNLGNSKAADSCPTCKEGHLTQLPYPVRFDQVQTVLELVHSDLCELPAAYDGSRYLLTLTDQYSRFVWTFALQQKSQVSTIIQRWLPYAERKLRQQLLTFQSDNGGEFLASDLQSHFEQHGIYFRSSVPAHPAQNGLAERMNRTLKEHLTKVLLHADLKNSWWPLALGFITFIRNVLPSSSLPSDTTPFIRAHGILPDLTLVKVWGCMAQFLVPVSQQQKLASKARWGIHLGIAEGHKAWRFLDCTTEQFVIARDATFYETLTFNSWRQRRQAIELLPSSAVACSWPEADDGDDALPAPVAAPQLPFRVRLDEPPLAAGDPPETLVLDPPRRSHRLAEKVAARPTDLQCCHVALEPASPYTYKAAMQEDTDRWHRAMKDEIDMLDQLGTWTLTPLPSHVQKAIGVKWVYRRKWSGAGYDTYKARLVAKGYSQREGEDFAETYAPVSSIITIRCLLAMVAARQLHL